MSSDLDIPPPPPFFLSQGVVQGPFSKADILDWFASGFFPKVGAARCICAGALASIIYLFD